jgi:hypothetical protein
MRFLRPIVAATVAVLISLTTLEVSAQAARIRVEPNVLISRDAATSHAEMYIAAHPTDPRKLIATATVFIDAGARMTNVFYGSEDGGQTWRDITPPHQRMGSSGDPWVGYSKSGTAMGIALVRAPGKLQMWVYSAPDGGMNWTDSVNAAWGDHERLAFDYGTGKFAGRMYLAGEYGDETWDRSKPETRKSIVGVWHSDDGKKWNGPIVAGTNEGGGLAVNSMVVLSDGRLVIHLNRYPNPGADLTTPTWEHLLAISDDGGATFAPLQPVGKITFGSYAQMRKTQAEVLIHGWGFDAANDLSTGKFRDRMYVTYSETKSGSENRIMVRHSSDRGATWSTPKEIAPLTGSNLSQFNPSIAVNKDGVVGIMWLDTRASAARDKWDAYFTASTDGGDRWLTPVRLSTETSTPYNPHNMRPVPYLDLSSKDVINVGMTGPFSIFPEGGHYLGVAADANGVFHPIWTDARAGAYQMMTARVRVDLGGSASTPSVAQENVTKKVTFDTDPARYDPATGDVLVPVRIKNISNDTIYGPFTVQVSSVSSRGDPKDRPSTLLNAANGKTGKGATMDYGRALRDMVGLPPGAVTEAVVWRFKPGNKRDTGVSFSAEVTSGVKRGG